MIKRKKSLFVLLGVVLIIAVTGVVAYSVINNRLEKLSDQSIDTPNLNELMDGTYIGESNVFPITVKVEVTLENHKIININVLKHVNGQGNEAEAIIENVVLKQQLNVDVISGATYSSKVILLAIEDALKP